MQVICRAVICYQVISLEGWVEIMYHVQDAHQFMDWIYFVFLIVVSGAPLLIDCPDEIALIHGCVLSLLAGY